MSKRKLAPANDDPTTRTKSKRVDGRSPTKQQELKRKLAPAHDDDDVNPTTTTKSKRVGCSLKQHESLSSSSSSSSLSLTCPICSGKKKSPDAAALGGHHRHQVAFCPECKCLMFIGHPWTNNLCANCRTTWSYGASKSLWLSNDEIKNYTKEWFYGRNPLCYKWSAQKREEQEEIPRLLGKPRQLTTTLVISKIDTIII